MRPSKIFWFLLLFLLALDQGSKEWVERVLKHMTPDHVTIIPSLFKLTYVHNEGVAFGLLAGRNGQLAVFTTVVLVVGAWWARRQLDWRQREVNVVAAMLFAGAIGNLIDRVRYGHVVDFLDFNDIGYIWVFNVADSCITLSLIWILLRQIFPSKATASRS